MEDTIVVETKMTREEYLRFSWFNVLKKGRHIKPAIYVMIIAFIIVLLSFTMLAVTDGFEYAMETSGTYLLIIAVFIPVYFLMLSFMFRLTYKRMANMITPPGRYEFTGEALIVEAKTESLSSRSEYKYDLFYRVFEQKDVFYLYVNKMQSFVLPKRDIEAQTQNRLAKMLEGKLGKKYVVCF